MGEVRILGGLSRAVASASSNNINVSSVEAPDRSPSISAIKPISPSIQPIPIVVPRGRLVPLRTSTHSDEPGAIAELHTLLVGLTAEPSCMSTLGVSPPVRSGAANPLPHSSSWAAQSAQQCRSNLRALQELRSAADLGPCPGDYRLLVASPEGAGILSSSLAAEEGPAAVTVTGRYYNKNAANHHV